MAALRSRVGPLLSAGSGVRRDESDELQRAQVAAQEQMAARLARIAHDLGAPEREAADRQLQALRRPLRRIFEGQRGAVLFMRAIPGFAELWERAVPESHVRETTGRDGRPWRLVRCMCGEQSVVEAGNIAECPGACGRWFLHAGVTVRVKRFEVEVGA